jgi:hypothetical protein
MISFLNVVVVESPLTRSRRSCRPCEDGVGRVVRYLASPSKIGIQPTGYHHCSRQWQNAARMPLMQSTVCTTSVVYYYYLRIRICHSTSRRKCHRPSTTVHLFVMDRATNGKVNGPMATFIWGWAYLRTERRPSNTKRSTKQCEEQQAFSNTPPVQFRGSIFLFQFVWAASFLALSAGL